MVSLSAALATVQDRSSALLLMHDNPDPDSMAAAECMRLLLSRAAGLEVTVARGGIVGRAENRAMVSVLNLVHVPIEDIDFSIFDVIGLVDTQPESGNHSLPRGVHADIVIDHHPPRQGASVAPWHDIREDYGASCTIAYHYLREAEIPIAANLATALLYAIKSETRDLLREASEHEFEAYSYLVKLADFDKLYAIAEPKVPAAHFAALDRALRAAEVRGHLLAVNLGSLDYPDLVAEIADLLLPYEKAHWVLCVGHYQGQVYLSVRTDVPTAHAGELIREVVGSQGSSGGHGAIAGGRLYHQVHSEKELHLAYTLLASSMANALGLEHEPSVSLL